MLPASTNSEVHVPCYFPRFYWSFRLSADDDASLEPAMHVYDVYENILTEANETPVHHRSIFHDFSHDIDPATQVVLDTAEDAFCRLESEVEETLVEVISQLRAHRGCRSVQVKQFALENMRRYFSFLRFRNCGAFKVLIRSIRESVVCSTSSGTVYCAYQPLISQLHIRVILRTMLAYLTPDDNPHARSSTERQFMSTALLRNFYDAMDSFCWTLHNAEVCIGMTDDEQEFLLSDICYATLADNYKDNSDCRDLIFPILPNLAIYLLGNVDVDNDEIQEPTNPHKLVNVSVGTECAIDVHLRNAMLLNSYPERLYFSCLRLTTLTLSAYDEFRWIQEHQDYSRLKQRCRQKFLQTQVTKTLVIKGAITLLDLTDEVELIGVSPVGFGSFSDVWKGSWSDRIEQKKKLVAVKYLRKVIFGDVREQLMKRLQAECMAWHRLCHRHVNQLYGLLQTSQSIGMVSQWCENGTITEYLANNVNANKMRLLVQVASGMAYLHSCQPAVIHGDLKGGNILIDEHGCAIISDFGLSKVMEGMVEQIGSSFFAGSTRWMAPELILPLVEDDGRSPTVTTYSDVFAFGGVCLEVVTGQPPYPHRSNDHAVLVDILRGVRPCRGAAREVYIKHEVAFWSMLEKCWDDLKKCRPSMQEMVVFLKTLTT
ncbi:Protein kinase-like domain containing protein [Amanita muscaria]